MRAKGLKYKNVVTACLIGASLIFPSAAYARAGDGGFEGGISAEQSTYKATKNKSTFTYQELCLITGKPVQFKGTLSLTKTMTKGKDPATSTYTYTYVYDLKNVDNAAETLKRTLSYTTTSKLMDNGQVSEDSVIGKAPTEVIKINNNTYTLKQYDYTRAQLIDKKPAIHYFSGNQRGRKIFQMAPAAAAGTAAGTAPVTTITVDEVGEFYGYDGYWGNTEVQTLEYTIQSEKQGGTQTEKWGGTGTVNISSTVTKELNYVENQPDQISFSGGYIQSQHNESVMEYHLKLPAFDSKGAATDTIVSTDKTMKLETYPTQTRLMVPDLTQLRGHWAEKDINILYSLGVFKGNESLFNPEQYITRGELAAAISEAAKEVPPDPAFTAAAKAKTGAVKQNFTDVSPLHLYFNQIQNVSDRGIMLNTLENQFTPNAYVPVADMITIFIRALGLESMAPNPTPVTTFRDNDKIPQYARKAAYVAQKIGMVQADEKGNLNPLQKVTKAKAAAMLNDFIDYMRDGIRHDYRDKILNY